MKNKKETKHSKINAEISEQVAIKLLSNPIFLEKVVSRLDGMKKISKNEIPTAIFNANLTCYETLVKYLNETSKYSLTKIANLLGKNLQSVWRANSLAKRKMPSPIFIDNFEITIPLSTIANPKRTTLENIIFYLKEKLELRFADIARVIHRDQRTVWTVYTRVKKGNKKQKNDGPKKK